MVLLQFHTLKRPSELASIRMESIISFPDKSGMLFNFLWGKTLRAGDCHVFGVRRLVGSPVCPIQALERYVHFLQYLDNNCDAGFIFKRYNGIHVTNVRLSTAQMTSDLRFWLHRSNVFSDQTMFGVRAAGAITLMIEGRDLQRVMGRAYLRTERIAHHYLKIYEVLGLSSQTDNVIFSVQDYDELNSLRNFVSAFPKR